VWTGLEQDAKLEQLTRRLILEGVWQADERVVGARCVEGTHCTSGKHKDHFGQGKL
jgi:hypothetical protein